MEALHVEMHDIANNADPLFLGMKLFSSKVIPKSLLDQAETDSDEETNIDFFKKNCRILIHIYNSLKENPTYFTSLCQALEMVYPQSTIKGKILCKL